LKDFHKDNIDKFNIIIIYISEAHAADIWNIGLSAGTINYSHRTIEDRIACVDKLVKTFNISIPIYADNMDNGFETEFASWPFRYFVTKGTELVKIGTPDDSEFDICELLQFVNKL
jgi:hypothetical protein